MRLFLAIALSLLCSTAEAKWSLTPVKHSKPLEVAAVADSRPTRVKLELREDPPAPEPTPPEPPPDPKPVAPATIELPPTLTGTTGDWLELSAKLNWEPVSRPVIVFDSPDVGKGIKVFPANQLLDPTKTVFEGVIPGQYRIRAIAARADVPIFSNWCIITITGAQPPPAPTPPPGPMPPPAPVPTASKLWIVTFDNVTATTPQTASVRGNIAFWNGLKAQGHSFKHMNITQAEAAGFAQYVKKLPAIVIMDPNTKKVLNADELDLPPTIDGVTALVKKYSGGK